MELLAGKRIQPLHTGWAADGAARDDKVLGAALMATHKVVDRAFGAFQQTRHSVTTRSNGQRWRPEAEFDRRIVPGLFGCLALLQTRETPSIQ